LGRKSRPHGTARSRAISPVTCGAASAAGGSGCAAGGCGSTAGGGRCAAAGAAEQPSRTRRRTLSALVDRGTPPGYPLRARLWSGRVRVLVSGVCRLDRLDGCGCALSDGMNRCRWTCCLPQARGRRGGTPGSPRAMCGTAASWTACCPESTRCATTSRRSATRSTPRGGAGPRRAQRLDDRGAARRDLRARVRRQAGVEPAWSRPTSSSPNAAGELAAYRPNPPATSASASPSTGDPRNMGADENDFQCPRGDLRTFRRLAIPCA
jgi:hypothetical protein